MLRIQINLWDKLMKESPLLVLCTCATSEEARMIAGELVKKKLAACVNIIKGVESVYHWKGTIENSQEILLLIKSIAKNYMQVEKEIQMLHSYSVPEIISFDISHGSSAYLDWIVENTHQQEIK